MRKHLLYLLCCLALVSCSYYGDIHGNSRQMDAASLSRSHVYKFSPRATASANGWSKFKDPQLTNLIHVALSDSPTLQMAQVRIKRAQYLADESSSTLWPSADLSGYLQRQKFSQFGLVPPPFNGQTFNISTLALNFNYNFDFWGKYRQAFLAKVNEQYAAEAEFADARLIISTAVAHTYFELCGNIALVNIAKTNWQLNKEILQIALDREKQGVESALPVTTIQANVEAAKLSLDRYRQAELLSRHQLSVLLGKNPFATHIETKPFAFHPYAPSLPSSLPARLIAQRPDIDAAKSRAEAAANQINVAKARFFPDINLSALLSFQNVGGFGHLIQGANQNNAITGAFDLPIFDAGARRANLGTKYAEYDLAVNAYNQTLLTALREVADQFSTLKIIHSQLATQKAALNATQRNYKLSNLRYHDGITDYMQVLISKQSLLQEQATLLNLQIRHSQTVVAMLKALGGNNSLGKNNI